LTSLGYLGVAWEGLIIPLQLNLWVAMRVHARRMPGGGAAQVELREGALAADLVRALGMPTAACLVLRGARPLPMDAPIGDGEVFDVIYVASGG
jgi:hypothetical protein